MKIGNFLNLALEISQGLNCASLTKRAAAELFNHLVPYFNMNPVPHILQNIVFKCHQSMRSIQPELMDANSRRVLGCLSFQVVKLGFQVREDQLVRRAMISELPITTRKWRNYAQYIIQRPQLTDEQKDIMEE